MAHVAPNFARFGNGGQIILKPGAGTVPGNALILGNDDGSVRPTPEQLVIEGSSYSNKRLLIGYLADVLPDDVGYGAIQATYANHTNTPLLLNPFGGGVGIGTFQLSAPSNSNSLTIGQGFGVALADGWGTYSWRRWKTNIQTLPDALDKVERLRGVSYDLKANEKHEIGVIAEEVGAVVPEIVQWDKNGKDANGVDYSRLTALLIEAVKQQAQPNAQQAKSKLQQAQISELRSQLDAAELIGQAGARPNALPESASVPNPIVREMQHYFPKGGLSKVPGGTKQVAYRQGMQQYRYFVMPGSFRPRRSRGSDGLTYAKRKAFAPC